MSPLDRFLRFREMEWIDGIRMDSNRAAWPDYADYLLRTVRHPDDPSLRATEIEMIRHWAKVPEPEEHTFVPIGERFPYEGRDRFYVQRAGHE